MSLRTKVLVYGVGIATLAMLILGSLLIRSHRDTYLHEAELRARTFLAVLAVETTSYMASKEIEVLDGVLATLMERNLDILDIQFVAVLDPDKRVVGHTDQWRYGGFATDDFSVDACAANKSIARRKVVDGRDLLLVSTPVVTAVRGHDGIRWGTAIAGIGLDRIEDNLMDLVMQAVVTTLLVILIASMILAIAMTRLIVGPIRVLTNTASRFARGDFSKRAALLSHDELADLCETFNDMADRIQAKTIKLEGEIEERNRELESANVRLKELATTDGLTGLYNYRYFEETLGSELRRSRRTLSPLSMLMIDVDNFKRFNDDHGHPAGDRLLRELATMIRDRVRATDVACRYGGEEFTIILPDTGRSDAAILAEELRDLVQTHRFEGEKSQPGGCLTISIGVSTFPDNAGDEVDLVRAADNAMYEAKKAGRNQVRNARD